MNTHGAVPDEIRSTGRGPRNRGAILDAARAELSEVGFRKLTIDSIAQRAQVGKATIYRWWPNKAAILLDALNSTDERYPEFSDYADTRTVLLKEMQGVIDYFSSESGKAFLDLVAESRFDAGLASALSSEFVAGRRSATRTVLERAVQRLEVQSRVDIDAVMDMLWGAVYYRFLVMHEEPDPAYARRLLDQIWPAFSAVDSA